MDVFLTMLFTRLCTHLRELVVLDLHSLCQLGSRKREDPHVICQRFLLAAYHVVLAVDNERCHRRVKQQHLPWSLAAPRRHYFVALRARTTSAGRHLQSACAINHALDSSDTARKCAPHRRSSLRPLERSQTLGVEWGAARLISSLCSARASTAFLSHRRRSVDLLVLLRWRPCCHPAAGPEAVALDAVSRSCHRGSRRPAVAQSFLLATPVQA